MNKYYLILILLFEPSIAQIVTPVLSLQDSLSGDQDDMCIWIHPDNNDQSLIITSDKVAFKLFVYDLQGSTVQTISTPGKPANIDIRYNFLLSGEYIDIVAFNDRTNSAIMIYKMDPLLRELVFLNSFDAGNWPIELYGFCLYKNLNNGTFYAFGCGYSSQIRQWELVDNGNGIVTGVEQRTWVNGSGNS